MHLDLKSIKTLEWYSLLLCIFSLPLFESPKTIFLVIAGILFILRHYIEKDYKDILFAKDPRLGFLSLALAATLSAVFAQNPWLAVQGSFDFLKMYLIFVIVATDFLDNKSIKTIALFVIASTTIGAVCGVIEYTIIKKAQLQLNSVGHFNHTSIYLAFSFWVAICFLNIADNNFKKVITTLCGVIVAFALILTTSRATFLALFVSLIVIFIFDGANRRKIFYIGIILTATVLPVLLYLRHSAYQLVSKGFGLQSLFSRLEHWNLAWEVFKHNPILGIGAKHFKFQHPEAYGVIVSEKLSHPHNLYLSILAQYGIVGFCALLFLFYLIFKALHRARGKNFMWPAALGAFVIVLINGLLNTTLHSEHGLLFSLIIAMGLNLGEIFESQSQSNQMAIAADRKAYSQTEMER